MARPVTVRHVLSHTSGLTGSSELQKETGSDSTPLKARALSSVTGPLQYHLRNGLFGHDGAYGTDLSVNPTNGMVASS